MSKEADPSAELGGLVASLKDALRDLPSGDQITVHDFEGREYKLRASMPARRQVQVFRALAQLLTSGQQLLATTGDPNWIKLLVELVTDEKVIEQLGKSFRAAFPDAAGDRDPLDVFPLEEIVASLVPLLARFVKRSGMAFADAGG